MTGNVKENHKAWKHANQGEVYRKQGMLLKAIREFNEAIRLCHPRDTDLWVFAHARRGATKLDLGYATRQHPPDLPVDIVWSGSERTPGALEDLQQANELDLGDGWTHAQMADAYRIYVRDRFRWLVKTEPSDDSGSESLSFDASMSEAQRYYDRALDESLPEQRAWLHAHRGALLFASAWALFDFDTGRFPEDPEKRERFHDIVTQAKEDLDEALRARGNYAWAKRFKAALLTTECAEPISSELSAAEQGQQRRSRRRQLEEAMLLLGEASLDDPRNRLSDLRSMGLLARYAAQTSDDPEQRMQLWERALQSSQQVLNDDAEDVFAAYIRASTLLDTAENGDEHGLALEVCRETRDRMLGQLVRSLAMILKLHTRMNGTMSQFTELIAKALDKMYYDVELLAMGSLDLPWRGELEGGGESLSLVEGSLQSLVGQLAGATQEQTSDLKENK